MIGCATGRMIYSLVLFLSGIYFCTAGAELIRLRGSPYYMVLGLCLVVAGVLVWRRRWQSASAVYAFMLAGTALWSYSEVGADGWALAPRLIALIVTGLPLAAALAFQSKVLRWTVFASTIAIIVVIAIMMISPPNSDYRPSSAGAPTNVAADTSGGEWPSFANGQAGLVHSPLAQVTPANVRNLKLAWKTYIDVPTSPTVLFESEPLKLGDSLYICTGLNDIVSLDAETGRVNWKYKANVKMEGLSYGICRGVAHYHVPRANGVCSDRIYTSTVDARLIALDSKSGKPCIDFGSGGVVDLLRGMGQKSPGYYYVTSAPTVVRDKLVVGGLVMDGQSVGEPSGVVRAFNAVTGRFAWAWDLGRPGQHGEPTGGDTYTLGTPNAWAPMSVDETLGLVYVPTGNATPDYWGGHRSIESNKYASSVVALEANSGEPRWSFQTTHYDLWDYDVGSQPILVDLPVANETVPALIQPTKRGELFVLDRRTGVPVFPVVEKPAPQSGGVGDRLSPTQPSSISMPYMAGPPLKEEDMWGITPADQLWCRNKFRQARYEGPLTPPGLTSSIADPGYEGGSDWGTASVDPDRQVMVIIGNRLVNYIRLITRSDADALGLKPRVGVHAHAHTDVGGAVAQAGTPYAAIISPFLSPLGAPCQRPPYSLLYGIDLKTGKIIWSRPLGLARDLGPYGLKSMLPITIGTPTVGGPMTTATDLTFVAASMDHAFRAFETSSGSLLWNVDLPYSSQSVPMSYYSDKSGRQFIAIVSGDGSLKDGIRQGVVMAFALPRP